jgi:protein TonB
MRMICGLLFFFSVSFGQAQESVPALGNASDAGQRMFEQRGAKPSTIADSTVWELVEVEVPPVFPGGEEAQLKYIATPKGCTLQASDDGCSLSTTVYMSYVVERDGKVSGTRVEKGGCPALQAYALCALQGLPDHTPGLRDGKAVRTRMRVPVRYELR